MATTIILELVEINYVEDRIELIAECNEYNERGERTQQLSRSPFIFPAIMTEEEIKESIRLGAYSPYFE
jgi:hypothetical protein